MKKLSVIAAALLASTALPANAATIIYTLTGNFSGTSQGAAFTNEPGIFTAIGDTNTAFLAPGSSPNVVLSSLSVKAVNNSNVFTFSGLTPTSLRFGTGAGGYAGFIVERDRNNPSVFYSTSLAGYDGVSNVAPISVDYVESFGTFPTSLGDLTITNQSNLVFSAAVQPAVAAVPEPATWAMMLMGFGMVGFGLRSRRKPTVRVAYA